MPVVPLLELQQRLPQFLDGVEGPHPQQLLLQRADEPFSHAVALRGPDEAWAGFDPQEAEFLLESMAHVLWTMIVAQYQAGGDAFRQRVTVLPDPLMDRLQRFKTRPRAAWMPTTSPHSRHTRALPWTRRAETEQARLTVSISAVEKGARP